MRPRSNTNQSRSSSHTRPSGRKTTNEDVGRSVSHRKTTNDSGQDRRSKSNLRSTSRASAGSKDRNRSKERKSTALSANSGSRTNKSQTSDEDSSDSDVDVDHVPFHLRKAVPLHLVEARILKKNEKTQATSPTAIVTEVRRRVAHQNVEPELENPPTDDIYDPPPNDQVVVRTRLICALLLVFFLWCAAMIPLLVIHVLTFYLRLGGETHTANADALFGKLEANVAQELAPALDSVYMLRKQASMGLFNVSDPYAAITRALAVTVQDSKQMQYIQIVGAAQHMLILRPGDLHYVPKDEDGDGLIDVLFEPDQMRASARVVSAQACEGQHQLLCFMEGTTMLQLQMVSLPSRHVTGSWLAPEFLLRSKKDELLSDPAEYPFVIRFLGMVNVTEGLPPRFDPNQLDPFGRPVPLPASIAVDVALSLERFEGILQEVTPERGSAYIFFRDGSILAGTGWDPLAVSYFKYEQTLEYEKIWELPTEWSEQLSPEDIESGERVEFYTSNIDLVVVKSLGDTLTEDDDLADSAYIGAAVKATSKVALRVLVVVPRDVAVAPLLTLFVDVALGVIIAPFALGGVVGFIALFLAIVRWCRDRCKPPEEEDPYLWKFDDDDDE
mmetsp:Transcript_55815/g.130305  ORF Transcript_55815/g.130305 Transcript_55815/m.130305 type:complete len:614 (-) Transcript_55815:137-1978(-)